MPIAYIIRADIYMNRPNIPSATITEPRQTAVIVQTNQKYMYQFILFVYIIQLSRLHHRRPLPVQHLVPWELPSLPFPVVSLGSTLPLILLV